MSIFFDDQFIFYTEHQQQGHPSFCLGDNIIDPAKKQIPPNYSSCSHLFSCASFQVQFLQTLILLALSTSGEAGKQRKFVPRRNNIEASEP